MPAKDKLIVSQIKKAKPKKTAYKLFDGGGLHLLIHPAGGKYWRLKYRHHGKEKQLSLGVFPSVSLSEARTKKDDAKKLIDQGIDPIAHDREQERLAKLNTENTFLTIAEEWIEKKHKNSAPATRNKINRYLEKDVFPEIGTVPISDLTTYEILSVIRKIEKRGAHEVASRVSQWIGRICRYAIHTGRITQNPATDIRGAIEAPPPVRHRAALSADELPEFFKRLRKFQGEPTTVIGLELLAHVFIRPGEMRNGRWGEIDIDNAEWQIPGIRMKMKEPHVVPLSKQSIQLLKKLHNHTGHHDLMFPSRNRQGKVISENTWTFALRKRLELDATAHGFRATASTILNESGWDPDVIERQLAHKEQNKVRAAYHRAEYLKERKKMMQWWSDYLDSRQKGAKIIPMHKRNLA